MSPPRPDDIARPTVDTAGGDSSVSSWNELALRVPQQLAEELLARFAERSLGAWASADEGPEVALRIYFATPGAAEEAAFEARSAIEREGIDIGDCAVEVRGVRDERWLERYQQSLRPFRFAGRFAICPGNQPASFAERIPIRLVPGRAFGTGEHATTHLSACLLEAWVRPGERWVDLGCGTGVLSLVAAHCGARHVVAVDNDPDAVAVAREVLATNGAGDEVEVRCGTARDLSDGWDGVVANILAPYFLEHSRGLARLVRPGGTLIASGFLVCEALDVGRALSLCGFESIERRERGEWGAGAFRRERPEAV